MLAAAQMKARKIPSAHPVRFRYRDVTTNVEAFLDDPATPKEMRKRFEAACELDHGSFSHRLSEYRNERFQVEHFGAMAEEADAPYPWPFVPWKDAEKFQAWALEHPRRKPSKR